MTNPATIEKRLREYAEWSTSGREDYSMGNSTFARIAEMQDNAGAHGEGFKPDIIMVEGEAIACRPDGGMSRMVERIGHAVAQDNRCREIGDFVKYLPNELLPVFQATYVGSYREVPRREREAAERMKISLSKYQKLKFGLLSWFLGAMYRSVVFMEDKAA